MTTAHFKHKDKEHVSRQDAADRLVAIAEALRSGGTVELGGDGQSASVQIADELMFEREYEQKGDRVEIELELSWLVPEAAVPVWMLPLHRRPRLRSRFASG